VGPVGVGDLPDEPRLPDARLTDERDHLAVPLRRAPKRLPELLQFPVPAHEPREPSRGHRMQPGPARARAHHLVDIDGRLQPLHRHRTEGFDLDIALREAQRGRSQQRGPGSRELLHSCG
jgi:hypothetical protein